MTDGRDLLIRLLSDPATGLRWDTQVKWNRAIRLANDEGNTAELIALLLATDVEVPPAARKLLADLLDRRQLRKKPGNQRLPINRRSHREVKIESAVAAVRKLIGKGTPRANAVEDVASMWQLPEESIQNALDGKRGSTLRARKKVLRT